MNFAKGRIVAFFRRLFTAFSHAHSVVFAFTAVCNQSLWWLYCQQTVLGTEKMSQVMSRWNRIGELLVLLKKTITNSE